MRKYINTSGYVIDLDAVSEIGPLFVNPTDPTYNCYEVYVQGGKSIGFFEQDIARADFIDLVYGVSP